MSYLNPPYEDNFKELCAAMPLFYLDVFEMREILKAQGRLMDDVCAAFELVIDNNFIMTADDQTIREWEEVLHIPRDPSLTLDQRRRIVAGYTSGRGHIGEPEIREIVGQYTENAITVAFAKGVITIGIEGEIFGEDSLVDTLLRRIPAHLALKIILHIRRVFRHEIPVGYAALAGSYFLGPPVGAGAMQSILRFRVANAGLVEGYLEAQPVSREHTASTMKLQATHAGFLEPALYGSLPDAHEAFTDVLDVSGGAFTKPRVVGAAPDVVREGRVQERSAGGAYYHTHIKSKLIE